MRIFSTDRREKIFTETLEVNENAQKIQFLYLKNVKIGTFC